jgi:hypothetical protein
MKAAKRPNLTRSSLRRARNNRITIHRFGEQNRECPAFLIRLVGAARAKDLSSDIIIHHRHD